MSTIYVNNLNEKVSINTLKRELQTLFKSYDVIDIHLKKSFTKKGQAFISFKDPSLVPDIMKKFNNTYILGKPMHVAKAHNNSYELLDKSKIDELMAQKKHKVFNIPSKTLMLNDFTCTEDELHQAFNMDGVVERRIIKSRKIMFIEFDDKAGAKAALKSFLAFDLTGGTLMYAKE